MDIESVGDSQDEDWREPWTPTRRGLVKTETPTRSPSPDELATAFITCSVAVDHQQNGHKQQSLQADPVIEVRREEYHNQPDTVNCAANTKAVETAEFASINSAQASTASEENLSENEATTGISLSIATQQSAAPVHLEVETLAIEHSGRNLRPRTFAQQHPWEYENAKYYQWCRENNVKPLKIKGFPTIDKDKDFVPLPEAPDRPSRREGDRNHLADDGVALARGALDESTAPTHKRRRITKLRRFKDPRKFLSSNPGNIDQDIFDFPQDHWADESLDNDDPNGANVLVKDIALTTTLANRQYNDSDDDRDISDTSMGNLSRSEVEVTIGRDEASDPSTDSSARSEIQAMAHFRRKLRGVLPPSYLSKKAGNKNKVTQRDSNPVADKAIPPSGRGVAIKKYNPDTGQRSVPFASAAAHASSLSDPVEISPNRRSILGIVHRSTENDDAVQYEFTQSEVLEQEEPIDRMLPTPSRDIGRKTSMKFRPRIRRSRPHHIPDIFLEDVVEASVSMSMAIPALRLACRTVRKKNSGGTQLWRKTIAFEKGWQPLATYSSSSPDIKRKPVCHFSPDTDGNEELETTLHEWKIGTLPVSRKVHEYSHVKRPRQLKILGNLKSGHDRQRKKERMSQVGDNRPPNESSASHLEPGETLHCGPSIESSELGKPGYAQVAARTYTGNLEHESGRFARLPRRTRARKRPKQDYTKSFDEIINVFQEPDFAAKVSEWQRIEIPKARTSTTEVETPALRSSRDQSQGRLVKKRRAHRVSTQASILPFAQNEITQHAALQPKPFLFPSIVVDTTFGTEALRPDVYFNTETFLGANVVAFLLGESSSGRVTRCYIGSRDLSVPDLKTMQYGFHIFAEVIAKIRRGESVSNDNLALLHNFIAYAITADTAAEDVLVFILSELECWRNEFVDIEPQSTSKLYPIQYWVNSALLLLRYKLSLTFSEIVPRIDDSITLCLKFLLKTGFSAVAKALRRQKNQSNRVNGIGSHQDDCLLELWVIVIHVCNITSVSFWTRINRFLELNLCADRGFAERAWQSIFNLASLSQFDVSGRKRVSSQHNWHAVEKLLEHVLSGYDRSATTNTSTRDSYIRILLRRVHALAASWQWPQSSLILGHTRTDGALHKFFFQTLGLGDLTKENEADLGLPKFLGCIQEPSCLDYPDSEPETAFVIFLKIICIGLRQYIGDIRLDQDDFDRIRRRGVSVVDKFATHGRLNYQAEDSIDRRTVAEIRNRFAMEIAIYWIAGSWKDRGLSKVMDSSRLSMRGSHLSLRHINIQAWHVIALLELRRGDDMALKQSCSWFTTVVETTVSDVTRFAYESRHNQADAKLQHVLQGNLRRCHETLVSALRVYHDAFTLPAVRHSSRMLAALWCPSITQTIISNHHDFNSPQNNIIRLSFNILTTFLKNCSCSNNAAESQDYGESQFSQEESGSGLPDQSHELSQAIESIVPLCFRFLTDISAQEVITPRLKQQAKLGLDTFAESILTLDFMGPKAEGWSEYFNESGQYSWYRLLDNPIKANMLPYFLAVLMKRSRTLWLQTRHVIICCWISSLAQMDLKDGLAALTTVLFDQPDLEVAAELHIRALRPCNFSIAELDMFRLSIIIRFLKAMSQYAVQDCGKNISMALLKTLGKVFRLNVQNMGTRDDFHLSPRIFDLHQILALLHEHFYAVLNSATSDVRKDLDWLSDPSNVPQRSRDFSADQFRRYAALLAPKATELTLILSARIEVDIIDCTEEFQDFMEHVLARSPLSLHCPPIWDLETTNLRTFVVFDILCYCSAASSTQFVAHLYTFQLNKALSRVYMKLYEVAMKQITTHQYQDYDIINPLMREISTILPFIDGSGNPLRATLVHIIDNLINHKDLTAVTRDQVLYNMHRSEHYSPERSVVASVLHNKFTNEWITTDSQFIHKKRGKSVSRNHAVVTASVVPVSETRMGDSIAL